VFALCLLYCNWEASWTSFHHLSDMTVRFYLLKNIFSITHTNHNNSRKPTKQKKENRKANLCGQAWQNNVLVWFCMFSFSKALIYLTNHFHLHMRITSCVMENKRLSIVWENCIISRYFNFSRQKPLLKALIRQGHYMLIVWWNYKYLSWLNHFNRIKMSYCSHIFWF